MRLWGWRCNSKGRLETLKKMVAAPVWAYPPHHETEFQPLNVPLPIPQVGGEEQIGKLSGRDKGSPGWRQIFERNSQ